MNDKKKLYRNWSIAFDHISIAFMHFNRKEDVKEVLLAS